MMLSSSPNYAQVSTTEEDVEDHHQQQQPQQLQQQGITTTTMMNEHLVTSGATTTTVKTSTVPIGEGLSWEDSHFDGKFGIVAAFDRNSQDASKWLAWKYARVGLCFFVVGAVYWILGLLVDVQKYHNEEESILDDICGLYMWLLGSIFGILAFRGYQTMQSQHIAITMEGIRVDTGTVVSTTIPMEHVLNATHVTQRFWFGTQSVSIVTVQRTAAPLEQMCCRTTRPLELYGIVHAQSFVDLVQRMKDSQDHGTYEGAANAMELSQIQ